MGCSRVTGRERRTAPALGRAGAIRRGLCLLLLGVLPACELTEIAAPQGEDVLVVEAVLRAGESRQRVLLHRSLEGRVVRGVPGAQVRIVSQQGRELLLEERPSPACTEDFTPREVDSLVVRASCYAAGPLDSLPIVPGETYELYVETPAGEQLRGRTVVPGSFAFRVPDPGSLRFGPCSLPPGTPLPLAWSRSAGAWSYLSTLEIVGLDAALRPAGIDAPERLELTGLSISEADTTLVLPTEFGVFERGSLDQDLLRALQGGFPAGVRLRLTVSAADRNFVNGVRGGSFNPSGNVRISSVLGDGIGVFGSLVSHGLVIDVGRSPLFPPCLPG